MNLFVKFATRGRVTVRDKSSVRVAADGASWVGAKVEMATIAGVTAGSGKETAMTSGFFGNSLA